MPEPSGRDPSPEQRPSTGPALPATSALACAAAFVGQLLAVVAAATSALPPNTVLVAATACSIIAAAALTELAPTDPRTQRAVRVFVGGHVVAGALLVTGLSPTIPWSGTLAGLVGLVAATTLSLASLMTARRAARVHRAPPLTMAPRVAAIVLIAQALAQRWTDSTVTLSMAQRSAVFLAIAALGVALLASLSIIALRLGRTWAVAGLLAWTVGWVASTVDLSALILWSLGGPFPVGPHQLRQLDPELVQILTTIGGLAIGGALVTSIRDARFRHSALVLLAGYAAFGIVAAIAEHRIELATDFPTIAPLRKNRDLADAITAFALAAVLWLYWRRSTASTLPRATSWSDGT